MQNFDVICLSCKYRRPISGGCSAFPNEIPMKFLTGKERHDKIEKGQVGNFTFAEGEPIELKSEKEIKSLNKNTNFET